MNDKLTQMKDALKSLRQRRNQLNDLAECYVHNFNLGVAADPDATYVENVEASLMDAIEKESRVKSG